MTNGQRHKRPSKTAWVRIGQMRVSPVSQRKYDEKHAQEMAADGDRLLEDFGFPLLNKRGGYYWIVDGQHRIEALKLLGFSNHDVIECEVFEDLTEAQEAEMFLRRNTVKAVTSYDKFDKGVTAKRSEELTITAKLDSLGLVVSRNAKDGCISAVAALRKVHRIDPDYRSLRILRDAWEADKAAFGSILMQGMGLVCQRYDGALNDDAAAVALSKTAPHALDRKAEQIRLKTGHKKDHCMAAAIVESVNRGRKPSEQLEGWWK